MYIVSNRYNCSIDDTILVKKRKLYTIVCIPTLNLKLKKKQNYLKKNHIDGNFIYLFSSRRETTQYNLNIIINIFISNSHSKFCIKINTSLDRSISPFHNTNQPTNQPTIFLRVLRHSNRSNIAILCLQFHRSTISPEKQFSS